LLNSVARPEVLTRQLSIAAFLFADKKVLMNQSMDANRLEQALATIDTAVAAKKLSADTAANARRWLSETGFAQYQPSVVELVDKADWARLEALFWEEIPFGTGGRRGTMAEFGSATINDRTIAESAQGIVTYLTQVKARSLGSAVIAYDTRRRSREFARLVACVFAKQGVRAFLFESHRSTPELSFAVRHLKCSAGVMISASHNPPADNGVKAYWSTGAQVLPPHDAGIIAGVERANEIPIADFDQAIAKGDIELVGEGVDEAYTRAVVGLSLSTMRDISALYSPLHGVGETSVFRVLSEAGFEGIEIFEPHRAPDGAFPNVPQHLPNPERAQVFEPLIESARQKGHALLLATDPDADRLGAAVRSAAGDYVHLSGNQIAALLTDYILRKRKTRGTLGPQHYIVETLVTTPLVAAIARSFKVRAIDNLLVGFKYIAQTMDREGAERFVFGCEESLGYLAGSYARDKDASIAALYLCEAAAELKRQNKTLLDRLDELYLVHGYHAESQKSETCQGAQGRALIGRLMAEFAANPPAALAGIEFRRVRDYKNHEIRSLPVNLRSEEMPSPDGDLMIFETAAGDHEFSFAARPSGTEPKIKFYFFARTACPDPALLADVKAQTAARLRELQEALSAWVQQVFASAASPVPAS
jgi:phosphoglucomutase